MKINLELSKVELEFIYRAVYETNPTNLTLLLQRAGFSVTYDEVNKLHEKLVEMLEGKL